MILSRQKLFFVVLSFPLFIWGEREYTDEQIAFCSRMKLFLCSRKTVGNAMGFPKKIRGGLILTTLEGVLKGGGVWIIR